MPTNEQRRQAAKRKLDRQLARRAERARRRRVFAVVGSAAAVVLVIVLIVLITVLGAGDGDPEAAAPSEPPVASSDAAAQPVEPATRPEPLPATVDCQYPPSGQPPAKPVLPPPAGPTSTEGTVPVTLETSAGQVPLTLDRGLAPCTVNNFLSLAQQGYYADTPCHRLTTGPGLQVLQCGDPSGSGGGGPGYSFADETFPELSYGRGYLAMANLGPNTNGSQFFLVYGDVELPPSYTVFGTISTEGLQLIDEIARQGTVDGAPDGAPKARVRITAATVAQ